MSKLLYSALVSHTSKVMFKILQARLQSIWTENFQMYKLDLETAEEPKIKLPTSAGSNKKWDFQKNIHFCFTDYTTLFYWLHLWPCGSQQTVDNSSGDGNTRSPYLPLEEFSTVCYDPHHQRLCVVSEIEGAVFEIPLLSLWCNKCWQFDLWFFCLF